MAAPGQLKSDPAREQDELRAYLGADFDMDRLWRNEAHLGREFSHTGRDEAAFYRTSEAYLYNLTAFAMSGTKLPYLRELIRYVRPPARVLDYGCGIGSDGLILLEAGYDVAFADFDNPSVEYLRWRLARRGLAAPIYDLDQGVPGGFDAVYAFDVIEHVADPFHVLRELESRATLVEVNFLEAGSHDAYEMHHELPIDALMAHVARRRVQRYRVLHGRSHLVLYRPERGSGAARLMSAASLARGRAELRFLKEKGRVDYHARRLTASRRGKAGGTGG